LARISKFMGVEYDINKGFTNETHPALIHAPTRIKQLETRAADLEWENKCSLSLRREIKILKDYLDEHTNTEYYPTF
jgi:hypothetical protein